MKQIFELSRRELLTLFSSPIGWTTLVVFSVHASFELMGSIDSQLGGFLKTGEEGAWFSQNIFSSYKGLFHSISNYFYLYIPFLTMGLMSREFSEGGIRLLFSSPLSTGQIVLGKYGALLVSGVLFISILLSMIGVSHLFVLDSIDWPLMAGGLLIVFLTICLYGAIGLFISSVTSYQLVAAVGTFATIFLMNNFLRNIVQNHHPEFLQLLINLWLPPGNHNQGISGLVNGADLIYYVILSLFFVALTGLNLEMSRRSTPIGLRFMVYLSATAFTFFIGWYSYRPENYFYFDITEEAFYSPSDEQEAAMKRLPDPVTLTRFVNVLERPDEGSLVNYPGRYRVYVNIRSSLKKKLDLNFLPYFGHTSSLYHTLYKKDSFFTNASQLIIQPLNKTKVTSKKFDLQELVKEAGKQFSWFSTDRLQTSGELKHLLDLEKPENHGTFLVTSGQQSAIIQDGAIGGITTQTFTTALKTMIEGKPLITFLSGKGERDPYSKEDSGYSRVFTNYSGRLTAANNGFEVRRHLLNGRPIPDSTLILVIADPQQPYTETEWQQIIDYINSGRNLLVTCSPRNKQHIDRLLTKLNMSGSDNVNKEALYGRLVTNTIISNSNKNGFLQNRVVHSYSVNTDVLDKKKNNVNVSMPNTFALHTQKIKNEFVIQPVVTNSTDTLVSALTRKIMGREQRILISASADFFSNEVEGIGFKSGFNTNAVNNRLAISILKWLSNDAYPSNAFIEKKKEYFTIKKTGILKIAMVVILPAPFLFIGLIYLKRRRIK